MEVLKFHPALGVHGMIVDVYKFIFATQDVTISQRLSLLVKFKVITYNREPITYRINSRISIISLFVIPGDKSPQQFALFDTVNFMKLIVAAAELCRRDHSHKFKPV